MKEARLYLLRCKGEGVVIYEDARMAAHAAMDNGRDYDVKSFPYYPEGSEPDPFDLVPEPSGEHVCWDEDPVEAETSCFTCLKEYKYMGEDSGFCSKACESKYDKSRCPNCGGRGMGENWQSIVMECAHCGGTGGRPGWRKNEKES